VPIYQLHTYCCRDQRDIMEKPNRPTKSWGRHRIWRLLLLTLTLLTLTLQTVANAQASKPVLDANALVRQMIVQYQTVQTLQEESESRFTNSKGEEFIQTTLLKYKRPNLIYLETHDPRQGTMLTYSNGRLATFYCGKENIYARRTAAPNFVGTLDEISKTSLAMIGVPQNQVLSPLSFLMARRMPAEASNFHYVKTEMLEGKRVALVTSLADPMWLKVLFPSRAAPAFQKREVSLWIDLNTRLLVRASFDLIWRSDNGVVGRLHFVETHRNIRPNTPLRDEDFNVTPPRGAEEKFPDIH
jgi:outer membrane lipoprotein-sorting protein